MLEGYYREPNGDYLYVDRSMKVGKNLYEGRATACAGVVSSVQTTSIHENFLGTCKRVYSVPKEWLLAIGVTAEE